MMKKLVYFFLMMLFSFLNGDFLYEVQEIPELLAFDKSEARSLNQEGTVVGKYQHDGNFADFIWIPDTFRSLEKEISPDAYPVVNNKHEVLGMVEKKYNRLRVETRVSNYYFWDREKRAVKGQDVVVELRSWWKRLDTPRTTIEVKAFNDRQDRLFQAYRNGECFSSIVLSDTVPYRTERQFIFAINSSTDMLVGDRNGNLSILDKKQTLIARIPNRSLLGVAMNDQRTMIATSADKTEGFFGTIQDLSREDIISLGSLIPVALNNHGDIVGKVSSQKEGKVSSFWLRKEDGTLIELSAVVDFGQFSAEKIVEVWAINDRGQILISMTFEETVHAFLLNPKKE